jgi:hypothetical protein
MRSILSPLRAKATVRFWVELSAGILSAVALVVTSLWPQWIEAVFDADPDGGSGEAEWGLVVGLCAFSVVMLLAARREWKRADVVSSPR